MLFVEGSRLVYRYDAEVLWVEAWGENAFRIRATKQKSMPEDDNWALQQPVEQASVAIELGSNEAYIVNGKLKAVVTKGGKITIFNQDGKRLLEEYVRHRRDVLDPKCSALMIEAREFKPLIGGDYHLTMRFESVDPKEKIFGMGQYQQPYLNLKGTDLELAHRNSQASVPFAVSSLGYGFLWNNPAVGRAFLGTNTMSFEAFSTKLLDYWVVAGDTPAEIEEAYAKVTGTVPMMPEYGLGFWQSKLRYSTQDEVLAICREYKRRNLPLDVIVIDFFHWTLQGEWKFDPKYWPDPDGMVQEITDMGIEVMVSIWPTVDHKSENFSEMVELGYLVNTKRGQRIGMTFQGNTIHYDATNPEARKYVWEKAKSNYYSKGIKIFWLDEAEPEYDYYDYDNYQYHLGPDLAIGNVYPVCYARTFYEGMEAAGQKNIVNLIRCAWAGSQKYGALVWSGDIASSWESLRNQLAAGLNMGLAGITWWTTDIGGFHGGDPNDEAFRELFARWFQWGAFCPVMRLHGDREPTTSMIDAGTGGHNEVWSYGEKVLGICEKYLRIREELRPYTRGLMKEAHEKGTPVIRPCFYDFPQDGTCWETEDQYMFGPDYLCCPVLQPGQWTRKAYLPKGCTWQLYGGETETSFEGGQTVEVPSPIESIPVFKKVQK